MKRLTEARGYFGYCRFLCRGFSVERDVGYGYILTITMGWGWTEVR